MQNRQGYCSYCCVHYNNLDQHLANPQHRFLTAQNRQWMGTTSLMERFLQDVLWHHPYHSQESRSEQNERPLDASPSQLVPVDDIPEEANEDDPGVREERPTSSYDSDEELDSRPSKPQENIQNVSIRPSVIQKLEKGQQQPLDFSCKSGNGLREFNPVGVSQATNNGQNVVGPSVSSNVQASHLLESSTGRPVTTNTTKLPQVAHLDSVSNCDPNKADRYYEQQERGPRNTVLTSCVKISSVSCQKPKVSDQKSVRVNSEKLILQEDLKAPDKTLPTGLKAHEFVGTEGSLKCESLSKLAVNLPKKMNKNEIPSRKGIFEDSTPKHSGKFSNRYSAQGENNLIVNKSVFLEQKTSAGSEIKLDCGYLQSSSDQSIETVQDLKKEKQIDPEKKKNALGSSEMSLDYNPSFHLTSGQSKVMAKEANLSEEAVADLRYTNDKRHAFDVSSNFDGFPQLATNQICVNVKGTNLQNAMPTSLVDECYNSSDSEMNFDSDTSLQPTDDYPQQLTKEENLSKGVYIGLVDRNYGSGSSEISADSSSALQSVVNQLPVAVLETKPEKHHICLVDKDYGSSSSEASFDGDSIVDHQLTVKERHLKENHAYLKDANYNPSCAEAHFGFKIVTDEPQKAVKEISLQKENGPMGMNFSDCQGLKINFHAHLADQSQVALRGVDPQEVAVDLENKSVKSNSSDLSFISDVSLYQSTNDQPQEALSEENVEESNIDMEVRSFGCSSSDLTFDSDPPFLSAAEHSEIDIAGIRKKYKNLEDKNYGSDSSDITFDSDISLCADYQSQVAVYEEKPTDPESKRNGSRISEMNFNSNMPLHSDKNQPAVVVKEIIKKEEYVHLERKNDEPTVSEIRLDSYVFPHSVTTHREVAAVKRLNLKKEEQAHFENNKYELSGSELNLDYNIFHSMTKHSYCPNEDTNFQRKENRHLENKDIESSISETSMKSGEFLVTGHPDLTAKEMDQKNEPVSLEDNGNRLSVSETSLYSTIPFQPVAHIPEVVVQEIWRQKEKHANSKDKMAESSDSEINSDSEAPRYSVDEPQIALKEINVQKVHVGNRSVICSRSEMILDPGVVHQSITEKPQIAILKKEHVDPGDEHPESRGFEIGLNKTPFHSVISQSKSALLKEKHVALEGANSERKIHFYPVETPKPLTEQFQEEFKVNLWKEDIGLENKIDKPSGSELNYSDVSLPSLAEQPEVAAKRIKLENQSHVYFEDHISQYNDPIMSLNSNFLMQSIVDQPQVNILEQGHIELEEKHHQFCGSEISFGSDGPVQSVADQLRETVKEISLWKDEVDVEDKRDASKGFEFAYESGGVFQSVAGQPEDILKGINFWKKHAEVENVEPCHSKINTGSNETLQPVTHEFQEDITELNLGKGQGYKINDSEIIYVSHDPLPSMVGHPHILEVEHNNLGEESDDPSGPEINFAPEEPLHSVTDQLQSGVTEICPWKEDHIYLEDKGYKLGNFEVNCDSETPVHFVTDKSAMTLKEISLQTEGANDLADKNYESTISEIKCNSGVCLQLKVDEPQVICKEVNLQKEEHLGMEEKTSNSQIICDSDVPLQILVDQHGVSVKETNLQKMLVMDLVTGDSDCEMISDSDTAFQPVVIDLPQMTIKGVNCINAEHFDLESESRDSYVSELRYTCDASSSLTKKSKDTFKVVNQKKDYIILQESSCESYGSEINFQIDPTPQSVTYQSQGPDKKKMQYSDSESKNCELNSPKVSLKLEDLSQSVTHQRPKADKECSFQKDEVIVDLKDNCDSGVSALDCNASPESSRHQNVDKVTTLQLKHISVESTSCGPSGSKTNFRSGSLLELDPDHPQKSMNKVDFVKKMSYTLKERKQDSNSKTVLMVHSKRVPDQVKEVIENDSEEPVLEALPHVPPSFVGKTWSQIMREDDMKINALVKEFREGRFHCYFDDDCETDKSKKKILSKGKKITWADLGQDTVSDHILSADSTSVFLEINDFSVALDTFSHHSPTKMPYDQPCRAASRCQTVKLSHGTQTRLVSHPGTKRMRQEEHTPKRKHSNVTRKRKKRVKTEKLEFPQMCTHVLKPLQPNALLYVLSSNVYKIKEDESVDVSKTRPQTQVNNGVLRVQYKYKLSSYSCYDTNQQIATDTSPPKMEVPEREGNIWVNIHFDGSQLNAEDSDSSRNSVKDELMTQERDSGHSVSPEKPETLNSNEVPKENNFQLSLSNCDAAKIPPTSVRDKVLERKKKIRRRKLATRKSGLAQRAYKRIILQQKTRFASEEQSIWIQTKLNSIIRKYIAKYSVFLRHKYQSRSTYVRTCLKKKSHAGRSKKPKRQSQMLSNSVPSGAEEKKAADVSSPLKQSVHGALQEPPQSSSLKH